MSSKPITTITGNICADPELRFSASGKAVLNFSLAVNNRVKDASGAWVDGEAEFFSCSAFDSVAENLAESVSKGMRVIASGRLQYQSWKADDGSNRSTIKLIVDEAGPSMRWATCVVTKTPPKNGGSGGFQDATPSRSPEPSMDQSRYNEEPFMVDAADWMPGLWGNYPDRIL